MAQSHSTLRSALLASVLAAALSAWSGAAESARIVFQNGKSIPLTAIILQGEQLVVQTKTEDFNAGQSIPFVTADHVYGDKPAAINQAIALLLLNKSKEAITLLEPLVATHRITAKIPGNFWLDAARALLVAQALHGNAKECAETGKEISEATPAQGIDPYVTLGKALLLPLTVKVEEREAALRDLTTDNLPADLCAYASYFRGNLFKEQKNTAEALKAYLMITCLFPSGSLILNAAAEVQAADLLNAMERREEAIAVLNSAIRSAPDTALVAEANKRLESFK